MFIENMSLSIGSLRHISMDLVKEACKLKLNLVPGARISNTLQESDNDFHKLENVAGPWQILN